MYKECLNRLTCHGLVKLIEDQNMNFYKLYYDVGPTVYIGYIHKNLPDRIQSRVVTKLYVFTKVRPYRLCKSRPAGLLNDHHHCHSARVAGGGRNKATGVQDRHFCMLITLVYTLSLFCNRQLEELCPQSPQV